MFDTDQAQICSVDFIIFGHNRVKFIYQKKTYFMLKFTTGKVPIRGL